MKTVNAALLSYGMSGQVFHAPFLHVHEGFNLLGSWERSTKLITMDYPYVKSYDSLEEVLSDNEVELVVVNTPTIAHYEQTKKALEAGKHVVVEKAFTTTTEEAIELTELAKSKGLKLSVFQNRRWDSDFLTLREIVESGSIGDVVEASFGFLRYTPDLSPKLHKELPSGGAGIVKDLGPHVIDQALVLFGMPNEIQADISITRRNSQVDDYFDITMFYDNKRVHAKGGYFFREPGPSFIVHGTKGSFLKSRGDVQEDQLKAKMKPSDAGYGIESETEKGLLHTEINGEIVKKLVDTHSGNYLNYYEGVYQALANDTEMPVTGQDGINTLKIMDAAYKSVAESRRVKID